MWVFTAVDGPKEWVKVQEAVFVVPSLRCSLEGHLGQRILAQMGLGVSGLISSASFPRVRQQLLLVENSSRLPPELREAARKVARLVEDLQMRRLSMRFGRPSAGRYACALSS